MKCADCNYYPMCRDVRGVPEDAEPVTCLYYTQANSCKTCEYCKNERALRDGVLVDFFVCEHPRIVCDDSYCWCALELGFDLDDERYYCGWWRAKK